MSEFLKVAVVIIMATPFAYMLYDVTRDLSTKAYIAFNKKAKPALIHVVSSLFN